ncbi:MAG: hypothetical protein KGJ63_10050, partial [Pseudomonadota bacterium]|nr:hypothetical protein [Pseudomonadota bacterium]
VWNLRYPRPQAIKYGYSIAATWDADTPVTPEGPLALPGDYQLVLQVDGKSYRAPLRLTMDPRAHADPAALAAGLAFSRDIGATLQRVWQGYAEIHAVRGQLDARERTLGRKAGAGAVRQALLAAVEALRRKTDPLVGGSGEATSNLRAINDTLTDIATDVEGADRAPTDGQRQAYAEYQASADKALRQWRTIRAMDLPRLNQQLLAAGLKAVGVPATEHRRGALVESHHLP